MIVRPVRLSIVAMALGLALAGCAGAGNGAGGAGASAPPGASGSNPVDVRFTQMMLPHHMQAVRNSQVEIEKGQDPGAVALARQILQAQQQEIGRMRGFLTEFGVEPMPAAPDKQQRWDRNYADLQAAPPQLVDTVFLTNMIPHHAAAVPMAELELEQGAYQPAIALAGQIKQSQLEEIMTMKQTLRR